jgi:hypothetical protein
MLLSRSPHSRQLLAKCLLRTLLFSSSRNFIVTERRISSSVPPILASSSAAWAGSGKETDADRILANKAKKFSSRAANGVDRKRHRKLLAQRDRDEAKKKMRS